MQKLYDETFSLQLEIGDPDQIQMAMSAFRLLLCLQYALPTQDFLHALSLCEANPIKLSKEDLLDLCFNFLIHDEELDSFRFAPLSVREYLESKESFNSSHSHSVGAIYCLQALLIGFHHGLDSPQGQTHLAPATYLRYHWYASMFWPFHLHVSRDQRFKSPMNELAFAFMLDGRSSYYPFLQWTHDFAYYEKNLGVISMPTADINGRTVDYYQMTVDSCRFTAVDSVQHPSSVDTISSPTNDPIYAASVWNFWDILEARIKLDARNINSASVSPSTKPITLEDSWQAVVEPIVRMRPLDLACLYGHSESARALLCAGAMIKDNLHNALFHAIEEQHVDIVPLLLQHGAPLDPPRDLDLWNRETCWPTGFNTSPLHQAVLRSSPAIVATILELGADPNSCIEGVSALDIAFEHSTPDTIRLLAKAIGANSDTTAEGIHIAATIYHAVRRQDNEICASLLHRLPPQNGLHKYLHRALYWAATTWNHEATNLLLRYGADPNSSYVQVYQNRAKGRAITILEAVFSSEFDPGDQFGQNPATEKLLLRLLLDAGADPNTQCLWWYYDDDLKRPTMAPRTMLQIAILDRNVQLMEMLLTAGADPNLGELLDLPLVIAVRSRLPAFVETLLKYGADSNAIMPQTATEMPASALNMTSNADVRSTLQEHGGKSAEPLLDQQEAGSSLSLSEPETLPIRFKELTQNEE